jgi:mannose-6-phosphate isomerase
MNQELQNFLSSIDKSKFSEKPFIRRLDKPWGWEMHFVPEGLPYMGKLLHIDAGKRLSLQIHDKKLETWFLLSGRALISREDESGHLDETEMEPRVGYTNQIGQKHRLTGLEDAEILEVSTPETGNTFRLEDDFYRSTETEEMRRLPDRGWTPSGN